MRRSEGPSGRQTGVWKTGGLREEDSVTEQRAVGSTAGQLESDGRGWGWGWWASVGLQTALVPLRV